MVARLILLVCGWFGIYDVVGWLVTGIVRHTVDSVQHQFVYFVYEKVLNGSRQDDAPCRPHKVGCSQICVWIFCRKRHTLLSKESDVGDQIFLTSILLPHHKEVLTETENI